MVLCQCVLCVQFTSHTVIKKFFLIALIASVFHLWLIGSNWTFIKGLYFPDSVDMALIVFWLYIVCDVLYILSECKGF